MGISKVFLFVAVLAVLGGWGYAASLYDGLLRDMRGADYERTIIHVCPHNGKKVTTCHSCRPPHHISDSHSKIFWDGKHHKGSHRDEDDGKNLDDITAVAGLGRANYNVRSPVGLIFRLGRSLLGLLNHVIPGLDDDDLRSAGAPLYRSGLSDSGDWLIPSYAESVESAEPTDFPEEILE